MTTAHRYLFANVPSFEIRSHLRMSFARRQRSAGQNAGG